MHSTVIVQTLRSSVGFSLTHSDGLQIDDVWAREQIKHLNTHTHTQNQVSIDMQVSTPPQTHTKVLMRNKQAVSCI